MLANMEMFAITHPGMKDLLEQCKVFYELSGSPKFFEEEDDDDFFMGEVDDTEELYDEVTSRTIITELNPRDYFKKWG